MGVRLIFQGHTRVRIARIPLARLGASCRNTHQDTGCFQPYGEWRDMRNGQVIRVTFRPTIYLNSSLSGAAADDALSHENRHFDDFKRLATALRQTLTAATDAGTLNSDNMESYWNWFLYDVCSASAAFHRTTGGMVEHCSRPSGTRPR
jgi:hypothetical protein